MKNTFSTCIVAVILLALAGCRTSSEHSALTVDAPGVQDQIFVLEAIASGAKEIEMGKLGIQRAQDLDLRLLAQRIFDDHTKATEDLTLLARLKNIPLPTNRVTTPHLDQLAKVPTEEFDSAFLNHLLRTHGQDITKYEAISRSAQSQDIRAFAATTLPVLREHQRIAYNIREINRRAETIGKEPAGAGRGQPRRDPYYQGDSQRHHQFDDETDR